MMELGSKGINYALQTAIKVRANIYCSSVLNVHCSVNPLPQMVDSNLCCIDKSALLVYKVQLTNSYLGRSI